MNSLRIGMFTTFYPPFNFGGDGIDVQRTATALARRGHRVTVVHDVNAYQWLAGRTWPEQPLVQDGVEVIGLRSRAGVLAPLLVHQTGMPIVHGRRLEAIARERAFDVVMYHNASLVGGPGLLGIGGDALKIYVAHEHWLVCPTHVLWRNNEEPCDAQACTRCVLAYGRPPQLWRYTGQLRRRLDRVDAFIARSAFSRDMHARFGFPKPMHVLPYFLPDERAAAQAPTEASPHPRPYFLFVGRLTRIKGLHTVLPQMAHYPDADLLVIGDGEDDQMLRQMAGSVPNIHFLGRMPNSELARFYRHAIAALCPTVGYETFGIVLIEAMRARVPVVARRIGPFTEIVEQSGGGLLYERDDELLPCLARLQQDAALRASLAEAGYRATLTHWSEPAVMDALGRIIDEGLHAKRAGRAVRTP